MEKVIFGILSFFLLLSTSFAQSSDIKLADHAYWDVGIEYGIDSGLGINVGYTNLGVGSGHISHGSISASYKDDGIDKWGERYESIGQRQFSQDIIDTGYAFITASGIVGLKITKGVHILGSIGYQGANYVQKRQDNSTILGSNGRYYTEYRDPEKSSVGIGGGVKFFVPISDKIAFTPTIITSTIKKVSISLGVAFC